MSGKPSLPKPRSKRIPSKHSAKLPKPVPCPPDFIDQIQKNAFDGRHVELTKPEAAAKAVWMRCQGIAYHRIEAETGLKYDTIRQLCWRAEDTIETKKKEFSRRYAQIAEMVADALGEKMERMLSNPEQLDAISPDRLALTLGIVTDHSAKLSGMAGVIIEHRKGASIDDAAKAIAEARARIADKIRSEAVTVEVIEE